jgi:hypothetical protein
MAISNVVLFKRAPDPTGLNRAVCLEAAQKIRVAATERLNILHGESLACVTTAVAASEELAAVMIDQAINTNAKAADVVERYENAVQFWQRLADVEGF